MKQKNKKRLSQYAVRYIRCQFIRKSIDRLRGSQSRKRYNQNCSKHDYTWSGIFIPPYSLPNFEIQKYYQNEPIFDSVYSRNHLPEKKDEAYVIDLDEFISIETHWIALYVDGNNIYFDTFGVEQISKEFKKIIGNKNIITNIYRIQAFKSITCGYCFI